jgi:putative hydrolase of the HAD superfamily
LVLLFDFGGTLDGDGIRWAVRFHDAYLAAGGSLTLTPFETHFRRSDVLLAAHPGVRSMGFRRMVETQADLLLDLVDDGAGLDAARVADHFCAATLETVARNRPILTELATRHRLGVVSNFTGNLDRCLAELGLADLFCTACDSTVVGSSKPDPGIFRLALRSLDAAASEAWMVGDNFDADVRPAAELGMRTCWLAPAERPLPAHGIATARVARLPDFLALVA